MPTLTAKQNGNYKVNGYNTLHVNVQPGGGGGGTAASISYDNTISALSATNVQAAIDELASDISAISVPDPSSTTPLMDGVATVGSEVRFARGDHRHPSDTSRVPTSRTINGYALTSDITLSASDVGALADSTVIPTKTSDLINDSGFITSSDVPDASSTTPLMDGTASTGSESAYARGDHVHPSDTSKQDVLTAGSNISISGNTISATDTTYSAGTDLTLSGTTINHDDSGVSAGTKGTNNTTALTPAFGGTFNVIGLAVNARGHITSANSHTVKIPNSAATTSAAGLMTAAMVTKLNGIATGATKNTLSRTQNTRSVTYSISANSSKSGTIAASVPSGYTVMGLGSINSGNTAVAIVTAGVDSTGKVTYVLRNVSSSAFTNQTAAFDIVYIKIA